MIHFKNISKKYSGDIPALSDINLHIRPKEFVSIIGQSGAGKSTLAKILIAQEKPSEGEIIVGGWDISDIKNHEIPFLRRQIGVIFQNFNILNRKTLWENVSYTLEVAGFPKKAIKDTVDPILKIVGLDNKAGRFPYEISGGELQRVAIARALAHRPKILIADEPTGNLDAINTQEILALLKKVNEFGTTVLLMTHNRDIVNMLRRRVITLENGTIVSDKEAGKYSL